MIDIKRALNGHTVHALCIKCKRPLYTALKKNCSVDDIEVVKENVESFNGLHANCLCGYSSLISSWNEFEKI